VARTSQRRYSRSGVRLAWLAAAKGGLSADLPRQTHASGRRRYGLDLDELSHDRRCIATFHVLVARHLPVIWALAQAQTSRAGPHGTGSSLSALLRGFTVRVTLLRTSLSRATAHDGLAIGVTSLYQ